MQHQSVDRDYQLARDRPRRETKRAVRLEDYDCTGEEFEEADFVGYICLLSEDGGSQPMSFQQAMLDHDSELWLDAAGDEYKSLMKNFTLVLIDKPEKQKTIGCKWIFTHRLPRDLCPSGETCVYQIHAVSSCSL